MNKLSLRLFEPTLYGGRFIEDFGGRCQNYQHTLRLVGGCWQAEWEFVPPVLTADYGDEWFFNRIGSHFEERLGALVIWSGIVDEIDYWFGGWGQRMNLLNVRNRIKTVYVDDAGASQETVWVEDAASVAKFGRIEEILELDQSDDVKATAEAESLLAARAWPTPEPLGINKGSDDKLTVRASGYVFTANYRFVSVGDGTAQAIGDYVRDIVEADMPFLTPGRIEANAIETFSGTVVPTRAYEEVRNLLLQRADPAEPPYTLYVDPNRRFNYYQISSAPSYFWENRLLTDRIGGQGVADPWLVVPGVIRNARRGPLSAPPGSFLEDGRDMLILEVTMKQGNEQPIITTTEFSDAAIMAAFQIREQAEEANEAGT